MAVNNSAPSESIRTELAKALTVLVIGSVLFALGLPAAALLAKHDIRLLLKGLWVALALTLTLYSALNVAVYFIFRDRRRRAEKASGTDRI